MKSRLASVILSEAKNLRQAIGTRAPLRFACFAQNDMPVGLFHGMAQYDVFEFNPGPLAHRSAELEAFLSKPLGEERSTSS
jgi:hypothetical protein